MAGNRDLSDDVNIARANGAAPPLGESERLNRPSPEQEAVERKAQLSPEEQAALDQEEADYRAFALDVDDGGTAGAGLAAITVAKVPDREQFFRTHSDFVLRLYIATTQQGLDTAFLGIAKGVVESVQSIGIKCYPHRLYLTVSKMGSFRLVPVRIDTDNPWTTSKEAALIKGRDHWTRMWADQDLGIYQDFPLPPGTYPDPIWPELTVPRILQLALRAKGRLVDSTEHPYYVRLLTGKEPPSRPRLVVDSDV